MLRNRIPRLIMTVLIALPCLARTADESRDAEGWTRQLHFRYRSVRGTEISPDGSLIAYVLREPLMEDGESRYLDHIWIATADGGENIQYTRGDESCSNPSFSPDGKYLAFTSSRDEKNQVWAMRVGGGEAGKITEAESGVASYRWTPDGKHIVYTMRDPETEKEKKEKKEKRDVILVDQQYRYSHLYVVPFQPNEEGLRPARRLTLGAFHVVDFDITPDGGTVVFTHQPDPTLNTGFSDQDISTVPVDSGAVTRLVQRPGVDSDPAVSPDGRWVAFVSHGGKPEPIGLNDLYVVPLKGGEPRKLADTPDRSTRLIGWSADSRSIFIQESVKTQRHVLAVPADGGPPEIVTKGEGTFGSVSLDRSTRRMAFTHETPDTPADVHVSPVSRFKKSRITHLHAGVPKPEMGRTELLRWTSFDGLEIEGLLTYPVGYEPGNAVPLIVQVHGGPAGVFTRGFTGAPGIYLTQYFAQHGYAILKPNPRGSSGYGRKFRYANVKDWGFGDFEDIMSGADRVIGMGVAHPDSLCVMGWSYGGYMTSFVVTKTRRFKAASMGAGLPNLISMTTTTDIPDYLAAHMGSEFWEDYDTYEKHSAVYRIKNTVTPTQVMHGQNDLRVPFTQGQEFYVALKRLGIPTEMVVYPRTPHSPREPRLLMDVSYRILKWFEKHLRGKTLEEGTEEETEE